MRKRRLGFMNMGERPDLWFTPERGGTWDSYFMSWRALGGNISYESGCRKSFTGGCFHRDS